MRIDESLRYVATQDVDNVSVDADVTVRSADGFELGRLDGFMVDPDHRTLRYYVVTRFGEWGMKLGLVPFVPGCLDAEHGVLRLLHDAKAQPPS
ncbi:MAG: hypothetical protein JJE40_07690 [Vicinamibacteria bacterium]|nr:hypothetical protein [Vicinamibacteria bacterium]